MTRASWVLLALAGLAGAGGVTLAAMAAHKTPDPMLVSASNLLMVHAAAVIAIVAIAGHTSRPSALLFAGILLVVGSSLFSGSIAMLVTTGNRLFPMATPVGGTTMIVGWLVLAATALFKCLHQRGTGQGAP